MAATLSNILGPGRRLLAGIGLVFLALPGCMNFSEWTAAKDTAPVGPIHSVHSTWEPFIVTAEDTQNNGAPLPGLAGRVLMFGENLGYPRRGNGKIDVAVFDISTGKETYVDGWTFDKVTLNQKLLRKDAIGWGYTLFLPSDKLRPELARVKITVRYVPESGVPLFAPPATVTLRNDGRPTIQQHTQLPSGAQAKK